MAAWLSRWKDAPLPYQTWSPFPAGAIVQVENALGVSKIAVAGGLWWGHEMDCGFTSESVIVRARRLDRPKAQRHICTKAMG